MNQFDYWVRGSMTCSQFTRRVLGLVLSTLVVPLLVFTARYYGDVLPPAWEQFFSTRDVLILFLLWGIGMLWVFAHFGGGTALVSVIGSLCFAGMGAGLLSVAIGVDMPNAGAWVMAIVAIAMYFLAIVMAVLMSFGLYQKKIRWFLKA